MSRKIKDISGQRFDRLVAISPTGRDKWNRIMWLCKCDCGKIIVVFGGHLRQGHTKSCGCFKLERTAKMGKGNMRHGWHKTKLYRIWDGMKRRCQNPNDSRYRRYGGKGIKVCNDWQTFIPFRDWALTNGYIEGLSIDRIDSNSNYEPQNCRWLTRAENSSRSTAKPVKCLETGEMFPSGAEAARTLGLSVHAVSYAIRRHGTAGDFHWQYDVSRFNEAKKAELNDRVKHDFNQRKQGSVTK